MCTRANTCYSVVHYISIIRKFNVLNEFYIMSLLQIHVMTSVVWMLQERSVFNA